MTEKEEAHRLYQMMRAEIKPFHDPKFLHETTMSVCSEAINTIMRAAEDHSFWYGVKIELGKIEDPEG